MTLLGQYNISKSPEQNEGEFGNLLITVYSKYIDFSPPDILVYITQCIDSCLRWFDMTFFRNRDVPHYVYADVFLAYSVH